MITTINTIVIARIIIIIVVIIIVIIVVVYAAACQVILTAALTRSRVRWRYACVDLMTVVGAGGGGKQQRWLLITTTATTTTIIKVKATASRTSKKLTVTLIWRCQFSLKATTIIHIKIFNKWNKIIRQKKTQSAKGFYSCPSQKFL